MASPDPAPPLEASAPVEGQGRTLSLALAAGLLAGGIGWLGGEAILEAYRTVLNPRIGRDVDPEAIRRFANAHLTSASGTFAGLGASLGLFLGLAGGLARRSASGGVRAALAGALIGPALGAGVSLLVLPGYFKGHDPQSHDLMTPMLTLGAICSAVGASGGLAFGLGLGGRDRIVKAAVGGLIGAALGTVVYELVGAVAFPTSKTELPISHALATRAILHVAVATLAAVGSGLALGLSSRRPAPPRGLDGAGRSAEG